MPKETAEEKKRQENKRKSTAEEKSNYIIFCSEWAFSQERGKWRGHSSESEFNLGKKYPNCEDWGKSSSRLSSIDREGWNWDKRERRSSSQAGGRCSGIELARGIPTPICLQSLQPHQLPCLPLELADALL